MTTLDDAITSLNAAVTTLNTTANTGYAQAVASAQTQVTLATEQKTLAVAQVTLATAQATAAAANAASVATVNAVASTQAGLAATSAASAATARDLSIAAWAASTAPAELLAAKSQSLHVGALVKAIVYDTSKDSDGGAWRQRCTDKSWYTETLGGSRWIGQEATIAAAWTDAGSTTGAVFQASATAGPLTIGKFYTATSATTATEVFRGTTRDFPAVAGIVAEASRVVIYDLSTGAMWMVFWRPAVGATLFSGTNSSVACFNGALVVTASGSGDGILAIVRFPSDVSVSNNGTTTGYNVNPVSLRNSASGTLTATSNYFQAAIASRSCNDCALTVLDNAPIDPNSGLPQVTIAVATAGGVSVIRDNGTVVNSLVTTAVANVYVDLFKNLVYGHFIGVAFGFKSIQIAGIASAFSGTTYTQTGIPAALNTQNVSNAGKYIGLFNANAASQLALLKENPATPAKGMVAYITNQYSTGHMVGDIRGAYLADTTAETVTQSGELVTNGTFATDTTGWTGSGATLTVAASRLRITTTVAYGRAYTSLSVTSGKTYRVRVEYTAGTAATYAVFVGTTIGGSEVSDTGNMAAALTELTFNSTVTGTVYLSIVGGASVGGYSDFDNISVKLAEPDRSVKNNGLIVNGTLTKTAVASGANLVAYSGFSAANYLEQPYNSQLDFGTGDFCVMGWATVPALSYQGFFDRSLAKTATGDAGFRIWVHGATGLAYATISDGTSPVNIASPASVIGASFRYYALLRVSGVFYFYLDGTLVGSAASAINVTSVGASLKMGGYHTGGVFQSSNTTGLSLWRISATAPSADQIAHIYRTELSLFQANAQCTIAGTSTAVTALAYDDATDLLHVGTSWGRTGFKDLLRVDSEATTTGALTSLSAQGGTVITGGTSAKFYVPAKYLRDELQRRDVARKALGSIPVFTDYDAVTSQVAFVLPKGYTTKAVYSAGLLKRIGSTKDYTVSTDGFNETVTFAVAPGNTVQVSIMTVRA